ncbi:tRNA (adenosine(37)-N6)-threonylcarbamoyltransferase complex ATPase subunit type 1 TsaE [Candidatus Omnitrophota bacterium]
MITRSPEETIRLGQKLARRLSRGDVVALYGDLGSGKTTFTKGVGKGLGVKDSRRINSPTFVLIKEYEARVSVYHLDLYRLNNLQDIEDIAVEEYIYGDGVTIIEWAEKIKEILPKKHINVRFTIKDRNRREIKIEDLRH